LSVKVVDLNVENLERFLKWNIFHTVANIAFTGNFLKNIIGFLLMLKKKDFAKS
jgi:hypothetical protein